MLERVALHQTRLRCPGLSLDARGVVLGSHGLLLFSSIDRLVAFFALYTQQQTLDDIVPTLRVEVLKSKLGTREVALVFQIDSSDRMDVIAEVAALAGGFTFTGSSRFWVQYRDAAAPYGYDVAEVSQATAAYLLHHSAFSQSFDTDRKIELRDLFLRLSPHIDPSAGREPGPRWVLAEWGLGGALIHYLRRSEVNARVGLVELPPLSPLDDGPVRRYLFDVPAFPPRMTTLLGSTPGLRMFVPASPGAAVEVGHRHPVQLRAVPAFRTAGLVLFHGRGEAPLQLDKLPSMGSLTAFAKVTLAGESMALSAKPGGEVPSLRIPLRLLPSVKPVFDVGATWVPHEELPLLRKLLYVLGHDTLRRSTIALTEHGAFVRAARGAQVLPLGTYYRALSPSLYVPAGFDTLPAVSARTLGLALDVPDGNVVVLRPHAAALAIAESSFVPLESAILEGPAWAPLKAVPLGGELSSALPKISLAVAPIEGSPMREVEKGKVDG